MMQVLITIFLMSFLMWSYNLLSKNFIANNSVDTANPAKATLFSFKRFMVVILIFIGCFTFISYTANEAKEEMVDEFRQEQMSQASQRAEEQEIVQIFEQARNNQAAQKPEKEIRVLAPDEIKTKFTDVAGLTEAKEEVQDIIRFLQSPEDFGRLGAKSPKGMLLYGEPGTGKTLMARAIAGEANVSFIAVAGSEFDEEYIGVGAARVRELFAVARQHAPCIIFIDEIDALAHKRNPQDPAWAAQTVNQLLAEMDGLDNNQNNGIVVIGASNRLNAIDPAVLRPGRLDRHIELDLPTLSERVQVLNVYLQKVKVNPKVNVNDLAKMTPGFSSAELANLVNEAAILATKANKKTIDQIDFDTAKDRIVLGSKREALKVTEQTRKITAYHEAGHALVGHLLGGAHQPLYKVTITPRGPSLGHTSFEPKDDMVSINLQELEARIATQLAGRVAEEIVFGEQNITTGAESDLKNATELAYNMVTRWGYSKRVGLIYNQGGHSIVSSDVIEEEVQAIIDKQYARAKEILTKNRAQLNKVANTLLERETIDAKEMKQIIANTKQAPAAK